MRRLIASLLISISCQPARAEVAAASANRFEIRDNTTAALAGGVDGVLIR